MSWTSCQMEAIEQALDIPIKVGCVERCYAHPDVCLEKDDDLKPAYKQANTMITRGNIVLPEGKDRKWFAGQINDAFAHNQADECYSCTRNMKD